MRRLVPNALAAALVVAWLALAAPWAHAAPDAGPTHGPMHGVDLGALLEDPASVQATAYVGANEVLLGRPFNVLVVVNAQRPDGQPLDVAVPTSFAQSDVGPLFDVGRRFAERVTRVGGIPATEIQIELTAWRVGDLRLPPIPVDVPIAGQMQRVYTRPITVKVVGLVGDDTASLRDIGAPVTVVYRNWVPVFVLVPLVALLLGGLLWWRLRRSRPSTDSARPKPVPAPISESPAAWARRRLGELTETGALDNQPTTPTIRALSAIVRRYLIREFDLAETDDATSQDILTGLRKHEWLSPDAHIDARIDEIIASWLARCDLVKFRRRPRQH